MSLGERIKALLEKVKSLRKLRSKKRQRRKIIDAINEHGNWGQIIYDEAEAAGFSAALGAALVEQESGFQNIFGCDWGSGVAFCHLPVTEARVKALIDAGKPNGIGPTQLTSFVYVKKANAIGGAWDPKCNIRIGFQTLGDFINRHGLRTGIGAYNGGEGNPQYGYADEVLARAEKWKQRF
jgi:hypothetical protein